MMNRKPITPAEQAMLDIFLAIKNRTFYGITSEVIPNRRRITRDLLCKQLGTSDRSNRVVIRRLRKKGFLICSDFINGGYWLGTPEEWNDWCDLQESWKYKKVEELR